MGPFFKLGYGFNVLLDLPPHELRNPVIRDDYRRNVTEKNAEQNTTAADALADHEAAPSGDAAQPTDMAQNAEAPDHTGAEPGLTGEDAPVNQDMETTGAPDSPDTKTPIPEVTTTSMSLWGQSGGSAAGLAMGAIGFEGALQSGDTTGIVVSGADVVISAADLTLDVASAAGGTVSDALRGAATKANMAVMVVDGVYQIATEDGLDNKAARAGAVVTTTGTAMAVGSAAATIGATGAAATAATVAAPIVAAIAVGMTADAAVGAYKVTEELESSIKKREQGVKAGDDVESSGAPSLQNYRNLRVYAATEANSPDGEEGLTRQEISQRVRGHEYSQDPAALDRLEKGLRAKIAGYNKVIGENDSWVHDSVRFFWASDKIDAQRMAKIDRAPYMAALNELEMYREEVEVYEQEQEQTHGVDVTGGRSASIEPGNFTGPEATYAGDNALMAEAAEAGIEIAPYLLSSKKPVAASFARHAPRI